ELFELAQDLRLLHCETFGREHFVGRFLAERPNVVEPAAPFDRALGPEGTPIEMGRPLAGHQGFGKRLLRQMSLTENRINEPHGETSCFLTSTATRPARASPATGESP